MTLCSLQQARWVAHRLLRSPAGLFASNAARKACVSWLRRTRQSSLIHSTSDSATARSAASVLSALSDGQQQQLRTFLAHLLEVNQVMNLTGIRDPDEAWQRHVLDSLALLPALEHAGPCNLPDGPLTVIDVGTGAGLPGMVFAVARPHWKVTLLDSLRKRCDFLEKAAQLAGVSNVTIVWARAEDAGQDKALRERHDLAVARAVADMRVLSELCLPFVRPGGLFLAAKGAAPDAEVAAAAKAVAQLGGGDPLIVPVDSFSPEGQRTAVLINKLKPTPPKFPRKAGTPSKTPL